MTRAGSVNVTPSSISRWRIAYWSIELDLGQVAAVVDAGELALPVGAIRLVDGDGRISVGGRKLDELGQVQLCRRR